MEIKKANSGPGRGLNEDWGAYVKTDAWNPVFNTMDWQLIFAVGAGGSALLGLSVFDHFLLVSFLSLQSPIVSFSPLNTCLILSFPASDDDAKNKI